MYSHGLIGNCQIAALVSDHTAIEWLCLPRPDSPPVFGRLLDPEGGYFSVDAADEVASRKQEYVRNTNVLVTTVTTTSGDSFRVTDFCPRFEQFGRMFRPFSLFRMVEPLRGTPRIRVECRPVSGWDKKAVPAVRGSSHLRYDIRGEALRLWTNLPLTYVETGQPQILSEKAYFSLAWNGTLEESLPEVADSFLRQTTHYWLRWVQHCHVPTEFQAATIRSALALKLHCYEDTGAILAALTTSLPEEPGHERNWDYRFCWLRDASFTLGAFHQLGHFEEMEGFLKFLLGIAQAHEESREKLRPVYALDGSLPLPEEIHGAWAGFEGSAPVRSCNQAAEHVQNDVYGEMLVALAPIYFDERFQHLRTPEHDAMMGHLARFCRAKIGVPDAGLWELRDGWREHSFSNLLCWAGLDRVVSLQSRGELTGLGDFTDALAQAEQAVRSGAVEGVLGNGPGDPTPDASLLLLPLLRFPDHDLCRRTVLSVESGLTFTDKGVAYPGYLYRYLRLDDFGRPASAFLICSYWLVQALVRVGETERARALMERLSEAANPLGLLAEHFHPGTRRQHGNFPQAYSHVGQILAAFAVAKPWGHVL